MALTVNEANVVPERLEEGSSRQRLLSKGSKILLDRLTIAPMGRMPLAVAASDLAWFQILDGEFDLDGAAGTAKLGTEHIVFLPPAYRGTLTSARGGVLLHAQVPDAARFDPAFTASPPEFRIVDWTREPVLDSQHDARKRIYVVTPKLFGTHAIKGEMIIYPAGTEGANHHHEGAEHFMYVLRGHGTAYANERPIPVRKGDLIYYDDHERHWLRSEGGEEMAFVEFFVPGVYKTVWAPGAPVCTWLPTGRDIKGNKPVREIKAHSSAEVANPADV